MVSEKKGKKLKVCRFFPSSLRIALTFASNTQQHHRLDFLLSDPFSSFLFFLPVFFSGEAFSDLFRSDVSALVAGISLLFGARRHNPHFPILPF